MPSSPKPLVVNADDLGLSKGVNRGIRRAHLDGIVTSTSLLTVARHARDAIAMLEATPTLPVGLHLALVGEDPPVLTAREVPTLVDAQGNFPLTYRIFLARAATGRVDPDDIRREFAAQLAVAHDAGLDITHLDSHQHVHLWPTVGAIVLDLAHAHGIRRVRLPRAHARSPLAWGVNLLTARLRRRMATAGLERAAYAGLDEAGHMDGPALERAFTALARSRDRVAEVNVHPGEVDEDTPRFDWDYRWEDEVAALIDPATREAVARHGFALTTFPAVDERPHPTGD